MDYWLVMRLVHFTHRRVGGTMIHSRYLPVQVILQLAGPHLEQYREISSMWRRHSVYQAPPKKENFIVVKLNKVKIQLSIQNLYKGYPLLDRTHRLALTT